MRPPFSGLWEGVGWVCSDFGGGFLAGQGIICWASLFLLGALATNSRIFSKSLSRDRGLQPGNQPGKQYLRPIQTVSEYCNIQYFIVSRKYNLQRFTGGVVVECFGNWWFWA